MDLINILEGVILEQSSGSFIISPTEAFVMGRRYGENRSNGPHLAVDIGIPVGTKLYAPHSGYISKVNNSDCGCGIDIGKRGDNYQSRFCHMSNISVSDGQWVNKGDYVGLSGGERGERCSGNSTAPHLHWSFKVNGKKTNPYNGWVSPSRLPGS